MPLASIDRLGKYGRKGVRIVVSFGLGTLVLLVTVYILMEIQNSEKVSQVKGLLQAYKDSQKKAKVKVNEYIFDFHRLGFVVDGDLSYVVGVSENCRQRPNQILNSLQLQKRKMSAEEFSSLKYALEIDKFFHDLPCPKDFPKEFEAYAIGDIGGPQLDIWKVSSQRRIEHVQNGVPDNISAHNFLFNFTGTWAIFLAVGFFYYYAVYKLVRNFV